MPVLSITKTYADGDVLFESDLDNVKSDIETFVNTTKLDDDNIQDAGITASTKLIDGTITEGKIASGAVTTNKIADSAVTTAKIAASAVTTAKIADSNVTTAKIADANVTTAKIADGAVTNAKRAALNYGLTSSCGTFSTSSTSYVDVTNHSISITTVGRPVFYALVPDGTNAAYAASSDNLVGFKIQLYNSTSSTSVQEIFASAASNSNPATKYPFSYSGFFTLAAGTNTFKIQIASISGARTINLNYYKFLMYEL